MKERVLLVNKFYYRRGGDCIYALNLEELLRSHGHEVATFAMDHPENLSSPWQRYFAPRVNFDGGLTAKLRGVGRLLGMGSVNSHWSAMLDRFCPDVVHLGNIHSYLSPKLASQARQRGIRVVWTLHDYKLVCPAYTLVDGSGHLCSQCVGRGKSGVIKHRCMKGSMASSVMAWVEANVWPRDILERITNSFVCPSEFMAETMAADGFNREKLRVVNNFVAPKMWHRLNDLPQTERGDYYCYVGRLSHEKGVGTLLEAASTLPHKLMVAGTGPLAADLQQRYGHCGNIQFLGHLDADEVVALLSKARCSVVPSEWHENNPLSAIESLCCGTPVIGTSMGGLVELVDSGSNGFIVDAGSKEQLTDAVSKAFNVDFNYGQIARSSLQRFSPERHYFELCKIYQGQ